jgi:hypothetical protein
VERRKNLTSQKGSSRQLSAPDAAPRCFRVARQTDGAVKFDDSVIPLVEVHFTCWGAHEGIHAGHGRYLPDGRFGWPAGYDLTKE